MSPVDEGFAVGAGAAGGVGGASVADGGIGGATGAAVTAGIGFTAASAYGSSEVLDSLGAGRCRSGTGVALGGAAGATDELAGGGSGTADGGSSGGVTVRSVGTAEVIVALGAGTCGPFSGVRLVMSTRTPIATTVRTSTMVSNAAGLRR